MGDLDGGGDFFCNSTPNLKRGLKYGVNNISKKGKEDFQLTWDARLRLAVAAVLFALGPW